jgi:hypothetical protein
LGKWEGSWILTFPNNMSLLISSSIILKSKFTFWPNPYSVSHWLNPSHLSFLTVQKFFSKEIDDTRRNTLKKHFDQFKKAWNDIRDKYSDAVECMALEPMNRMVTMKASTIWNDESKFTFWPNPYSVSHWLNLSHSSFQINTTTSLRLISSSGKVLVTMKACTIWNDESNLVILLYKLVNIHNSFLDKSAKITEQKQLPKQLDCFASCHQFPG